MFSIRRLPGVLFASLSIFLAVAVPVRAQTLTVGSKNVAIADPLVPRPPTKPCTVTLFSDRLLPFGAAEAQIWGRLSARIGHSGADLLIAATALSHDATVVTRNVADFAPTGCRIENPFA